MLVAGEAPSDPAYPADTAVVKEFPFVRVIFPFCVCNVIPVQCRKASLNGSVRDCSRQRNPCALCFAPWLWPLLLGKAGPTCSVHCDCRAGMPTPTTGLVTASVSRG